VRQDAQSFNYATSMGVSKPEIKLDEPASAAEIVLLG
jgi:hypothetical protein